MNEEQLKEYNLFRDEFKNHVHLGTDNRRVSFNDLENKPGIDSLTDVVISSPTSGDYLTYNGTNWVNAPFPTDETFSYTFAESVTSGTPVRIGYDTTILHAGPQNTSNTNPEYLCRTNTDGTTFVSVKKYAQSFIQSSNNKIKNIKVTMRADSNFVTLHTPGIKMVIYTDNSNEPSATSIVATAYNGISFSNYGNDEVITWTFSSATSLTGGTKYWFVLELDLDNADETKYDTTYGSVSGGGVNVCNVQIRGGNGYSNGTMKYQTPNSSIWNDGNIDLVFTTEYEEMPGYLYKADATTQARVDHYIGLAGEVVASDGTSTNVVRPNNFFTSSSLTAGTLYYLTDTAGTLGTSQGTVKKIVGTALSTTKLLLQ